MPPSLQLFRNNRLSIRLFVVCHVHGEARFSSSIQKTARRGDSSFNAYPWVCYVHHASLYYACVGCVGDRAGATMTRRPENRVRDAKEHGPSIHMAQRPIGKLARKLLERSEPESEKFGGAVTSCSLPYTDSRALERSGSCALLLSVDLNAGCSLVRSSQFVLTVTPGLAALASRREASYSDDTQISPISFENPNIYIIGGCRCLADGAETSNLKSAELGSGHHIFFEDLLDIFCNWVF
jgi:hypothetical protein